MHSLRDRSHIMDFAEEVVCFYHDQYILCNIVACIGETGAVS